MRCPLRSRIAKPKNLNRSLIAKFWSYKAPWHTLVVAVFITATLTTIQRTLASDASKLPTLIVSGDYGYQSFELRELPKGTRIDARGAVFRLSNSSNPNPRAGHDCKAGTEPVNRYPVKLRDIDALHLLGARVTGEVPQNSDWKPTYCNSSAVTVFGSDSVVLEGLRIDKAWDGVRFTRKSRGFTLTRSWISRTRDDCIENDQLRSGTIQDTLFDGCFYGISVDPAKKKINLKSAQELTLNAVLMRLTPYSYRNRATHGMPFKTHEKSPQLNIHNSLFAFETPDLIGYRRLARAWQKLDDCSNNVILWFPSEPIPDAFKMPPAHCFRIVKGVKARTYWERAKKNWIDCHPEIVRFAMDPKSEPAKCRKGDYGGRLSSN